MTREFIFTMGLPAAGKSTIAAERFGSTHTTIDPDEIKKEHPDYNHAAAFAVHDWSTEVAERRFQAALLSTSGNFLFDGTGTNAEAMVRRMTQAKAAGFTVTLVYVTCSLATSLRRAALRERKVPRQVIVEKARNIDTAFRLVAPHADKVEVINND